MAAHLAGKPAQFEIAAKKIQRLVPTPVDDALAQKMGIDLGGRAAAQPDAADPDANTTSSPACG